MSTQLKTGGILAEMGLLFVVVLLAGVLLAGAILAAAFVGTGSGIGSGGGVGTGGGDLADAQAMSECQAVAFLEKEAAGGMRDSGPALIAAAQKYNVNPALMIGIANAENSLGRAGAAIPNKNPGNVKLAADTARKANINVRGNDGAGHTIFASWEDGWAGLAYTLRTFYLDEGRTTLGKMSEIYLTGDKQNWINNIKGVMERALEAKC